MTISYEDGRARLCTVYGYPSGECRKSFNHKGRCDFGTNYVCTSCWTEYPDARGHLCPESLGGVSA